MEWVVVATVWSWEVGSVPVELELSGSVAVVCVVVAMVWD